MSTTIDPWIHVLQQLEPAYFKWKDILDNGPKISAEISRRGRVWVITLQEEPTPLDIKWSNIGKLDERVKWAVEQLTGWSGVARMAYDMFYFKRKRDAEKFQTLYNLKWASE